MSYYEFPHTRSYDKDLGWLIHEYKELSANYQGILDTVKRLEEEYDTIPQKIQEAINQIIGNIDHILELFRQELKDFKVDVCQLEEHVFQLKMLFLEISGELYQYVDRKDYELFIKLSTRIDNIVKEWPKLIDPSDGYHEDLQTVLFHIWNDLSYGIPVSEFDSMNIPVEEFDNMQIPVWRFDNYGREIFADRRLGYMESPFTGEYVPVADVVTGLASLHMDGITVEDFDGLEITASEFDGKMLPVVRFDWDGKNVLSPYVFVRDNNEAYIFNYNKYNVSLNVMKGYGNVLATEVENSEEYSETQQIIYCGHITNNPFQLDINKNTVIQYILAPDDYRGGLGFYGKYDGTITQLFFITNKTTRLKTLQVSFTKILKEDNIYGGFRQNIQLQHSDLSAERYGELFDIV